VQGVEHVHFFPLTVGVGQAHFPLLHEQLQPVGFFGVVQGVEHVHFFPFTVGVGQTHFPLLHEQLQPVGFFWSCTRCCASTFFTIYCRFITCTFSI